MEKVKKHSPLLILGLLLLGVCMRMPITSIPSVIKEIAQTFNVAPTSLGILTTIPLLCFGLLSSVVSATAQRIGNELTIAIAMVLSPDHQFPAVNGWDNPGGGRHYVYQRFAASNHHG